ncbi:MAG TPA: glutathione peroxidase [Bacteroidia bacterium]|nr:glutathione peroxidase [Bacteroidia bacterium]MBV6453123.1 Hydroperoxy fatty acid reductase gpx1 [Bacteroidia bacterium]MCE7954201.1 glutathione peroxidase [Bacteroidetes bacterium CHB6]HNR47844.1 glutathione peroxidase [Bacteroidia bacterium]HRV52144.1 glutathione peroxidase [Bacteroidia bacterium]
MKLILIMATLIAGMSGPAGTVYDFKVDGLTGGKIDLSQYKGKKILIVNTASKCGYTPQYKELEELYEKYKDKVVVIGFPANNFLWQEPGTNSEIAEFCTKNYSVTFPMAAKISVKGKDMHPLFKWLIEQPNPDFTGGIKWNFEKFLLDENGKLIHRYRSAVNPMSEEITKNF